ncbi:MAG: GTPase Era [Tissierellia bacterium]|nr:GTPase Era [Tissierellia bacterium]
MKSGFVSLIGRPNVGKSSILNYLIGMKLAIVTNKPQTTRNSMKFIYNDDRMQVIFFDNPGYQRPKNKLGERMNMTIEKNMVDGDLNLYVMDESKETGPLDQMVLDMAARDKKPKILLINKMDLLDAQELSQLKERYENLSLFDAIVPISAHSGEGFEELLDRIYGYLPEGPKFYGDDEITDVNIRNIMEEILREKCLLFLDEEIPHGIYIDTEEFHEEEDRVKIRMTLYLERENHKGMVIGKEGKMIKRILSAAEKDMTEFLEKKVKLKIDIKIRKNWRKKSGLVQKWF